MFGNQITAFYNISNKINNGVLEIIGNHKSSGHSLPVVKIKTTLVNFTIRDNLYDINIFIDLKKGIELKLSDLYEVKNEEFYLNQIQSKREYSFGGWTDEEINDPRILRVLVQKTNHSYWSEVSPKEKDRWLDRYNSTDWYTKDWSENYLIKDEDKYYLARYCFAEGIKEDTNLQPYSKGMNKFFLYANNIKKAEEHILKIYNKCLTN